MMRSRVVLPQPLGPMTVRNSLSRTSKSILLSARTPPLPLLDVANSLFNPRTLIMRRSSCYLSGYSERNKYVDVNHPPLNPLPSREGRLVRFPLPLRERGLGVRGSKL